MRMRAGLEDFANDSRNSMGPVPILRRCSPYRIYTPAADVSPAPALHRRRPTRNERHMELE
jgi:hypothetical protein